MIERVSCRKLTEEEIVIENKYMELIVIRVYDSIFAVDKKCYENYIKNKNGV